MCNFDTNLPPYKVTVILTLVEVSLLCIHDLCVPRWCFLYRMLAYRAEDISQRLEPQELYDRQEFEESIQFDVSHSLQWNTHRPT